MVNFAGVRLPGVDGLFERVKQLENDVRFLRSSRNLVGRATVESGKSLLVKGLLSVVGRLDLTGTLSMKTTDGTELFRMGDMTFGRGIAMTRDDGSDAFVLRKPFSDGDQQQWVLYDMNGASVIAENPLTGGLSRPYLEHPFQPVAATSGTAVTCGPYGYERTTSSTSFETLFAWDGKRQNGFLDLKIAAVCSDGSTAGEMQVVNLDTMVPLPGYVLAPWLATIPAGTTTLTLFDPTPDQVDTAGVGVGAQLRLGLQVRRTAGSGSITVAVPQAIGG
jgi:hypothetical protein